MRLVGAEIETSPLRPQRVVPAEVVAQGDPDGVGYLDLAQDWVPPPADLGCEFAGLTHYSLRTGDRFVVHGSEHPPTPVHQS